MIDNFDEELDNIDLDYKPLTLDELKVKIPSFSSKKLSEIIVVDRCFGGKKELAILCMEELASRRIAGDNFDFESYIENSYNEMPKLNDNIPNITNVLQQFVSGRTKK